jgi:hypothetical protein
MSGFEGEERRQTNGDLARLVAEAGAKLSILEDARTEMRGLKDSVLVLSEAIALAPTAEEVEAAAHRARWDTILQVLTTIVTIIVIGGFLLHGQALGRQGTRCVALQLFEHRVSNQASHDKVFDQFHIPAPPRRALPPEPSEAQIAQACGPFLPKGY